MQILTAYIIHFFMQPVISMMADGAYPNMEPTTKDMIYLHPNALENVLHIHFFVFKLCDSNHSYTFSLVYVLLHELWFTPE